MEGSEGKHQHNISPGLTYQPSRTSTDSAVGGRPSGSSLIQATLTKRHSSLSARRYRSIQTRISRFRDSFYPQAIRLLNCWNTKQLAQNSLHMTFCIIVHTAHVSHHYFSTTPTIVSFSNVLTNGQRSNHITPVLTARHWQVLELVLRFYC